MASNGFSHSTLPNNKSIHIQMHSQLDSHVQLEKYMQTFINGLDMHQAPLKLIKFFNYIF